MKKQPEVICIYAKEGGDAAEIIKDSFRLFVQGELRNLGLANGNSQGVKKNG